MRIGQLACVPGAEMNVQHVQRNTMLCYHRVKYCSDTI